MCLLVGCLGCFKQQTYCFWKIQAVLRRTNESAVVRKRTFNSSGPEKTIVVKCSKSTAAALARMIAGWAGAGLAAAGGVGAEAVC